VISVNRCRPSALIGTVNLCESSPLIPGHRRRGYLCGRTLMPSFPQNECSGWMRSRHGLRKSRKTFAAAAVEGTTIRAEFEETERPIGALVLGRGINAIVAIIRLNVLIRADRVAGLGRVGWKWRRFRHGLAEIPHSCAPRHHLALTRPAMGDHKSNPGLGGNHRQKTRPLWSLRPIE
jgi:hypothetical protein